MPFVNVKLVKDQVSGETKKKIISGLTDLIVRIMNRERSLTTIVVDEIDSDSWAIGGKQIHPKNDFVSFVNIKVSAGTTNSTEMAAMMQETKNLMSNILGNHIAENYFIIDELNPSAWGFDGISMTQRSKLEIS
ncbi:MAG: 4-oxalocrotonate tautomerase family protein [Proteobacteria bacterium]|nr:4-oxalocrotonate tautomerase family protein [Pseudomonadota bacterium]